MLLDDNVKQQDSPLKTDGYDILEVQDSDSDEAAMSNSAMILHTNILKPGECMRMRCVSLHEAISELN